jgi:hypothetical protein
VTRMFVVAAMSAMLLMPVMARAEPIWGWGLGYDPHNGHGEPHKHGGHGGAPFPLLASGVPGLVALASGYLGYRRTRRQAAGSAA